MIIDELIAILGYDVRGEANLAKFNQGLDRAAQRAQITAQRLNAISVAIGSFAGMAAFAAVNRLGSAIGSLPGQVIDVGKTFEALNIRLNTLEGSSDKAEKAMDWIKQFAKDTPLDLTQVADAYADLKNFGLDPTAGSLQALTDAMSASGQGTQMLGRLTLAIGQAWVKQKLQGQEILQLTEAGIPVWDMLAKATGKNVQQLQKLSSAVRRHHLQAR
jgi:tape measure domain-containing protein